MARYGPQTTGHGTGMSAAEVGKILGLSRQRVLQIEQQALNKIRAKLGAYRLDKQEWEELKEAFRHSFESKRSAVPTSAHNPHELEKITADSFGRGKGRRQTKTSLDWTP